MCYYMVTEAIQMKPINFKETLKSEMGLTIKRIYSSIQNSGLSYGELSQLTGIAKSALHRYATGQTQKIPLTAVEKIANATGVSTSWLMGLSENEPADNMENIIPMPKLNKIPLLGTIACGEPILAAENIEDEVDIPENIVADFALRCKGDSMIDARINDGDIVYIKQQPTVENGTIAAVLIGDEATLKRVYISGNTLTLAP